MNRNQFELKLKDWKSATLGETHLQTQKWISQISFVNEEIAFMLKVVSKHFSHFASANHIDDTYDLTQKMEDMKKGMSNLQGNLRDHEKFLLDLYLTKDRKDENEYRKNHGQLAKHLYRLMEKYAKIKKDFFIEAGDILKEEKQIENGRTRINDQRVDQSKNHLS